MITTYTTFNDIRAALGVSEEEIDDATLGLNIYKVHLDEGMLALNPLLVSTFAALPAVNLRTAAQTRFAGLVSLYATYAVAFHLLDSVELFGFLRVADGRASTERAKEAFANLRVNISAMLSRVKGLLLAALLEVEPTTESTATLFGWVSAVDIAADPVTQ